MTTEVDRLHAVDRDEDGAGRIPPRFPLACGALGRYEAGRVAAVAQALECEMVTVHEDADSALRLDRPALTWTGEEAHGFAWSEGVIRSRNVARWEDAACRWGACGLVVEGHRRYLHSSVSGVAPLYYLRLGAATYFASRIEALVHAGGSSLSVDWDAWAAIFFLGYAPADRTPFLEVRRLEPFSVLEAGRDGGTTVSARRWPWGEVEPGLSVADGVEAVVESARSAVRALPAGRIVVPLSGGWDSRLILSLLQEERPTRVAGACTLPSSRGHSGEELLAADVAAALGVSHTVVEPAEDRYVPDFVQSVKRMEYQRPGRAWMMPLADRLRGETGMVTDGLALDVLFQPERLPREPLLFSEGDSADRLWATLAGAAEAVLARALAREMAASARRQLQAIDARWRGHPARGLLTLYSTMTVRSTALRPVALLGRDLAVGIPFTDHELAVAALSIAPDEKLGGRLYRAVFADVNPAVGALPSTHALGRRRSPLGPWRATSPQARRLYRWAAVHGPLGRHLAASAREQLTRPAQPRLPSGDAGHHFLRMVAQFTLWHHQYRGRIRDIDLPTAPE